MKKKIRLGIILIFAALCIAAFFLLQTFAGKEERTEYRNYTHSETVSPAAVNLVISPVPTQEKAPDPAVDESRDPIQAEFNPDILDYMGVTKEDLLMQVKIFANSCGYGAAREVKDLDELYVDYSRQTITVPCRLSLDKKTVKFDCIYNYEKKKYRFVPW